MRRIALIVFIGLSLVTCTVSIAEQGMLTPDASVPLTPDAVPTETTTVTEASLATASLLPSVPAPTQSSVPTLTSMAVLPTATSEPLPSPTLLPTASPEICSEFYFFSMPPDWEGSDLCPEGPPVSSWMAEQVFEGGRMLWIEKQNLIYILFGNGQLPPENFLNYSFSIDTWTEDEPESDPGLIPPPGFYQPIRGFGKVWRESAGVHEGLGWAVAPEQGYNGFYQYSQRRDTWMGNTYYYYQSLDGHIIALQQYRRGWHWGFVR